MQAAAPEIADLSTETEETFELYGDQLASPGPTLTTACSPPGWQSEMYVSQLFHRGWDQHGSLKAHITVSRHRSSNCCLDHGSEQRGLLEVLVIWAANSAALRTAKGS